LHLFGGGVFEGGSKILNLNNDPYNPTYAGKYDQLGYVHDGYVDNDTLYASHINIGVMAMVDVRDKSNPVLLGTIETPGNFTHNTWVLSDRKHILTTDEKFSSFVTAYDVSNPDDIQELDRVSTTVEGQNSIGHNTHVRNDWAITSWYTDGVTIVDAHRPDNLVEVARHDNYAPQVNLNDPFEGCWGAFPYFASGTIVTSNISPAVLNVYTPDYVRACYLEGKVINGCNGFPLFGAKIEVNTPDDRVNTTTKLNGVYKTGYVTPGDYTVTISKPGFVSQTHNFTFAREQVTEINVTLVPENVFDLSGVVVDAITNQPVPNVRVSLKSASESYAFSTDNTGSFSVDCTVAETYQVAAGAWGYLNQNATISPNNPNATIALDRGYYDDFRLDLGWTSVNSSTAGEWEIGEPDGTTFNGASSNPEFDIPTDEGDRCFVTGNEGGGAGNDDVDDGSTTATSPKMDLWGYNSAVLSFYYWFFNDGGTGAPPNDFFQVNALIDGQIYPLFSETVSASEWRFSGEIALPVEALSSHEVYVEFVAADEDPGHLVEAAFDVFKVELGAFSHTTSPAAEALLQVSPNPSNNIFNLQYNWEGATELPVLEVRNLLGQVVHTAALNGTAGVYSCGQNWAPGVYIATLKSGSQRGVPTRLVKG
jgi:hypothetical protein